jgi:hypothetical protein
MFCAPSPSSSSLAINPVQSHLCCLLRLRSALDHGSGSSFQRPSKSRLSQPWPPPPSHPPLLLVPHSQQPSSFPHCSHHSPPHVSCNHTNLTVPLSCWKSPVPSPCNPSQPHPSPAPQPRVLYCPLQVLHCQALPTTSPLLLIFETSATVSSLGRDSWKDHQSDIPGTVVMPIFFTVPQEQGPCPSPQHIAGTLRTTSLRSGPTTEMHGPLSSPLDEKWPGEGPGR